MRTAIITEIKGLSIQTQQNTFVLFTSFKLTLDERKTLTKISTCKTSHNHSPNQRTPQTTARKHPGCKQQVKKKKKLFALEQRIPDFPNCDNYGLLTASNPDPLLDDTPTNDNELHQVICNTFKIDYFQEMDTIVKLQNRLECKINYTLPALLPKKLNTTEQGLVTSGESVRNKRAIPTLAIIQGIAAIGGMMIKGINALVDAKRASSFNNAIKLVNENVQITHD